MSISDIHNRAADRNLTIVHQLRIQSLQGISPPLFDWMVVVYFYAAVRYINGHLSASGDLPRTHAQRKRLIATDDSLRLVMSPYSQLESRSRRARYDADPELFTVEDVELSLREAETIRAAVLR